MRSVVFTLLTLSLALISANLCAQEAQQPASTTAQPQAMEPELKEALDEKRLSDIGVDFKAIYRIAELCDDLDACKPVVRKMINMNLESLREPRKDGSYRWASFQRIEESRVSEEKEVLRVFSEAQPEVIEVAAKNAYSVVIAAPKKRSTFSANNKVNVVKVVIEATGTDGVVRSSEVPVNTWVNPGDSHTVPLPDIAVSARARVYLGVESGEKKAVANVALLQATLVDDPQSPYFPATKRLVSLKAIVARKDVSRGDLKAVSQEAVLELPGELQKLMQLREAQIARLRQFAESNETTGMIALGDATPDVVHELRKTAELMRGTAAEQDQGRAKLDEIIAKLAPPAPAAAPEASVTPK